MSGGAIEDDEEITDINVTPLVDIMMVLLIIFMVTTSQIVNKSIEVNLPKAATGEDVATQDLAFVINKESALFLNGETLAFEQVGPEIERIKADNPDKKVQALISADRETPHGQVINLIDIIRKNGISDFAINVEAAVAE